MSGNQRPQEAGVSALASGELELLGLMPNASNYTFLGRVRDPDTARNAAADDGGTLVIYKPRAGETPLWDFPEGSLCLREVAAWETSDALGWDLVPETILRDGPHGVGSVQRFISFDPQEHYFTLRESRLEEFRRVALLDTIINNADRKGGHCLLGSDGNLRLIDHGVCFHAEPKLRTVVWDFAGEPVASALLDEIGAAAPEVCRRSADLLDPLEIKALAARLETLLSEGRYPVPGAERHYPWPPV